MSDKILKYNDTEIFIIFDENGDIWFRYKDVLDILGYNDSRKAMSEIKIDNTFIKTIFNLKKSIKYKIHNLQPNTKMINNNGLFMVLSVSNFNQNR